MDNRLRDKILLTVLRGYVHAHKQPGKNAEEIGRWIHKTESLRNEAAKLLIMAEDPDYGDCEKCKFSTLEMDEAPCDECPHPRRRDAWTPKEDTSKDIKKQDYGDKRAGNATSGGETTFSRSNTEPPTDEVEAMAYIEAELRELADIPIPWKKLAAKLYELQREEVERRDKEVKDMLGGMNKQTAMERATEIDRERAETNAILISCGISTTDRLDDGVCELANRLSKLAEERDAAIAERDALRADVDTTVEKLVEEYREDWGRTSKQICAERDEWKEKFFSSEDRYNKRIKELEERLKKVVEDAEGLTS